MNLTRKAFAAVALLGCLCACSGKKATWIRIVFICLLAVGYAKGQQFKWAVSGGTWVDDFVNKMIIDKKGNIYTTGHIGSFGSSFGVTFNEWGYFLMKQDSTGAIKWIRSSTGSYDATGRDIAVDSHGNVYVTGDFNYNLVLTDTTLVGGASGPDGMLFFIKYDSSGNRKWAQVLGDDGHAGGGRVSVDSQDNIYLAGNYITHLNLGNGVTLTGDHPYYWGYNDVFMSRFSPSGTAIWGLSFSTFSDDIVQAITAGPGQKVYLMVQYVTADLIAGHKSFPLGNQYGSYIASCDPDGNILTIFPTGSATDLLVNEQGDFYVSGLSETTGGYISKIRSDHVTEWIKPIETHANGPFRIAFSGKDVYVGSNYHQGTTIDSLFATADHGMFTAKISNIGVAQWIRNYPGVYSDRVNAMADGGSAKIGMGGYYADTVLYLDGHVMTNNSGNGDGDIFIGLMHDSTESTCPRKNSLVFAATDKVCWGDSTLLSTNTGTGYYRLDWYAGNQLVGSGGDYHAKEEGDYHYIRYPGTVCADTSNFIHITIIPLPLNQIAINPGPVVCSSPVAMQAVKDIHYTYQWFKDGLALHGRTFDSLVTSQDGAYYCRLVNLGLCPINTDTAHIKVYRKPVFHVQVDSISPTTFLFSASDESFIESYSWTVTGTTLKSHLMRPTFRLDNSSVYEVCLQASNPGCLVNQCDSFNLIIMGLEPVTYNIGIFPNPFTNSFVVTTTSDEEFSVVVYDLYGRQCDGGISQKEYEIRTDAWSAGMYFAQVSFKDVSEVIKVIKH